MMHLLGHFLMISQDLDIFDAFLKSAGVASGSVRLVQASLQEFVSMKGLALSLPRVAE